MVDNILVYARIIVHSSNTSYSSYSCASPEVQAITFRYRRLCLMRRLSFSDNESNLKKCEEVKTSWKPVCYRTKTMWMPNSPSAQIPRKQWGYCCVRLSRLPRLPLTERYPIVKVGINVKPVEANQQIHWPWLCFSKLLVPSFFPPHDHPGRAQFSH